MRARGLIVLLLLVGGCLEDGIPAGDPDLRGVVADLRGVVVDMRSADLAVVTDLGNEKPPAECISTCDRCGGGGCCGTACCGEGEWCDSQQRCRCGTALGCGGNQICGSGGPTQLGQCGSFCCGDSANPCPL